MKKVPVILLTSGITLALSTTLFALSSETVTALLNRSLSIEYNGKTQTMTDANGKTVYPITYNDSTYLPVRAICDMLGIEIDWDEEGSRVLISDDNRRTETADKIIQSGDPVAESEGWKLFSDENSLTYLLTNGSVVYSYSPLEADDQRLEPIGQYMDTNSKLLVYEEYAAIVYPWGAYEDESGSHLAENGVQIDLSTGKIIRRSEVTTDDFISLYDYDGTLAKRLSSNDITCTPMAGDNYFMRLCYTLTTSDGEINMTAVKYFRDSNPVVPDLVAGRALIGSRTKEFMPIYDKAYEAAGMLDTTFVSCDRSDSIEVNIGGSVMSYLRINDSRFEKYGIRTLSDFENFLSGIYTEKIVDELTSCFEGGGFTSTQQVPYFLEKDGVIYSCGAARGSNEFPPSPIYSASGDTLTLVEWHNTIPDTEPFHRTYTFGFVKSGESYLCDSIVDLLY